MLPALLLVLLVAGVLVFAYAVLVERRWYRVRRHRLAILPREATGLTVLHLSDLHLVRGDEGKRRFLASLPRTDVAVITGDVLGEPEAVEFASASLRPVRGRVASLFVLGSNDLFAPRPINPMRYLVPNGRRRRVTGRRGRAQDLVRELERDGWVHLRNRKCERRVDGVKMEIVGLDDPHIHRADLSVAPRTAPDAFGLAVVHAPDPAPELAALGYDLVMAGHTHGGQVRLPVVGAIVTNCSIPTRLARGLARLGRTYLHVSPGLGTSKYAPFRLLCRPEATLLELSPRDRARADTPSRRPTPWPRPRTAPRPAAGGRRGRGRRPA
ncbi:MAG TPA: metallophosphoesterase [Actinomycetota bacterium]|nr:metallophosphoesterase [Actinomycetota bacterium]